ncbi:hypothetical protein RJ640_011653 [Escallonia rubra]|uniref:Helicase C-terminal domain-containing protein n=1 Tax=Escallonia rubra TaxID=112253 RepID=A0AA88RVP8_9ASTE|nr:hypothetical protein RJ640_011653 [Escallonia rubra]
MEIDRHFIKEKIEQGVIEVDYALTRQQTADVLTKAVPRGPFDIHLPKLGLIDIHSPAPGGVWNSGIGSKNLGVIRLDQKDLRCIVFVERVITAIVLQNLLSEVPKVSEWKTEYMAGNHSVLQAQSRNTQNRIVDEFRKGTVNIIVATSILEEGLDVQSCDLVIRFDPSATVCSFIQSRGRARMQNSVFLLLVESEDSSTLSRVENYLSSGDVMRKESLRHASIPCEPVQRDLYNEMFYEVEGTGAKVLEAVTVKGKDKVSPRISENQSQDLEEDCRQTLHEISRMKSAP